LNMLRTNVVMANPASPRGPGSAGSHDGPGLEDSI
jgi:hypothetical protein